MPMASEAAAVAVPQWRTAHNMSSASLRKRYNPTLLAKVRWEPLHRLLANLQEVLLGTKLFPLFPVVPLTVVARCFCFGQAWIFGLSLIGLVPLAEHVSFLSEQIAYYAGPTVNASELIIALFALHKDKMGILKWSLHGSIISNLLLVLGFGSSFFYGGLSNLNKEHKFNRAK